MVINVQSLDSLSVIPVTNFQSYCNTLPQLCLSLAFKRASQNKCGCFLQRPRLRTSSVRPALLEIGPSYSHECRLIRKTRFTDLSATTYHPLSWVLFSLILKMSLQLSYFCSNKILHQWRTELTEELIYGATVCISTFTFIPSWDAESLFPQWQFEKLWKYFVYALSIETKYFGIVETESPSLASLRWPQLLHFVTMKSRNAVFPGGKLPPRICKREA